MQEHLDGLIIATLKALACLIVISGVIAAADEVISTSAEAEITLKAD